MADIDLVGQKIDNLSDNFEKSEKKWDKYIETSNARLKQVEIQTALLEQSNKTVCTKIENLDNEVERINLLSKIIGGIAGGLAVIAAAIGISK
jgi:hypothetical protein